MPYLLDLLRRSRHLYIRLLKIMVPVLILVRLGQELGWVDALGRAMAPLMSWLNLPAEAGMVWVTGALVGVYGAIAALVGLAGSMGDLTAAQFSAICAMTLFAHSLPIEQSIVRSAGGSLWITAMLRIVTSLGYGAAVSWACHFVGVLDGPAPLAWLQDASAGGSAGWLQWARGTVLSLIVTYFVITGLLVLLDLLQRLGITRRITAALTPLLRFSGLDERVTPVTTIGVLLGVVYGGALIIEEARKQQFSACTRLLALSWLSLSHSLIEDTLLFLAMGANIWIILVGRVVVTLLVVAVMARLIGPDKEGASPGGVAGQER